MRILVALLVTLGACSRAAPTHPNVLLVTIDTLRADAVGADTPAIDAFFRDATRFRGVRTAAPLTLPAHTSLFTGLLPARHGMHDNVNEPLPPRGERSFPLLAEQLRDAGYATAAFVAREVLAPVTGIGSGFDLYDCPGSQAEWEDEGGYVPGEERIRAPLAWIEGAPRGRPWFVWVHLFDPHAPYHAFPGDARRAPTRESDPPHVLYAGEVRRADAAFEKLLREIPSGTVVILASDHGEGLSEHGEQYHGALCYGSTIDTVLAVRAPGFDRGAEDAGLRSITDIAPTLRRICHLPAVRSDGLDLAGPPHETLVSESLFAWSVHGWGQAFAVTDGRHSLVEAGESVEVFDRSRDHGETAPIPFSDPAYEKLDRALERFRAAGDGAWGEGGEMLASVSPYNGMRLCSTGYLSRHENARLLNPRDHQQEWSTLLQMPSLIRLCTVRRDVAALERALKTLDAIEKVSKTPKIDHYRAGIHAAVAEVRGVPAEYSEAAWAEIRAIEKGYVGAGTVVPAVTYCIAASDAAALQALRGALKRSGRRLDAESEQAIEDARRKLGTSEPLARMR